MRTKLSVVCLSSMAKHLRENLAFIYPMYGLCFEKTESPRVEAILTVLLRHLLDQSISLSVR